MNLTATLLVGAGAHALVGAGVFLNKEEPYKGLVFAATTIKGLLIALLIAFSMEAVPTRSLGAGAGFGLLYGVTYGLVAFLAKGAHGKTAPPIFGGSAIQGILTGVLIALFGLNPEAPVIVQ